MGGSLGQGWQGEVVHLLGLVGSGDLWSMLQVQLGQPGVVLWAVPFEPNKELWLFVESDQSVGDDIFSNSSSPSTISGGGGS